MQRKKLQRHLRQEEESRRAHDLRQNRCLQHQSASSASRAHRRRTYLGLAERQETRQEPTEKDKKQREALHIGCPLHAVVSVARENFRSS